MSTPTSTSSSASSISSVSSCSSSVSSSVSLSTNNNHNNSKPSLASSSLSSPSSSSSTTSNSGSSFLPIVAAGHSRNVVDLSFSYPNDDGVFLISGCLDGKAMLRDGSGDWIGSFIGHKGAVHSARLNDKATQAVTASADWSCRLWDATTGDELHSFEHKHIVKAAHFSQDCKRLFTAGHEKKIRLYDLAAYDKEPTVLLGASAAICHLAITADPNIILSSGQEKGVRVWDLRTNSVVKTLETNAPDVSLHTDMAFTTVNVSCGREVSFFALPSLDLLCTHKLARDVTCLASHGRTRFLTGSSSEPWVRLYDFTSGSETNIFKGHHGLVHCIAFDSTGSRFASGASDATIRIWDLPLSKSASSTSTPSATTATTTSTASSPSPSSSSPSSLSTIATASLTTSSSAPASSTSATASTTKST